MYACYIVLYTISSLRGNDAGVVLTAPAVAH